jgi:hypothetical protein
MREFSSPFLEGSGFPRVRTSQKTRRAPLEDLPEPAIGIVAPILLKSAELSKLALALRLRLGMVVMPAATGVVTELLVLKSLPGSG